MKNSEILKKSIEKSIKNGWNPDKSFGYITKVYVYDDCCNTVIEYKYGEMVYFHGIGAFDIIFNHDFAKAFFGTEWMFHIACYVLKKDPIKYFERFLNENN